MISGSGKLLVPTPGSQEFYRMKVRLLDAPAAPTGFALIPAGVFTMGDALDGDSNAPTHTVTVSAFYMAQNLVTKADWDTVRTWAISNGYSDLEAGAGKASNHPVQSITWYQMVKWCNARSQQEGLTPVYYTNDAQTTVYKTGDVNVTNAQVKWAANGYRLPTEAEWEKAARGGLSGKRFPWGDMISHSQANYYASSSYSYDLSGAVNIYHPTYATGSEPYTSPVGSFAANGYGLNDMAGNVWQWCWDWYGTYDTGTPTDPRGVSLGADRVGRGGAWDDGAFACRVVHRDYVYPSYSGDGLGFRVARSSVP
jgi:formylglycine-generating enzyme required for sulfatase activity